MPAKKKPKKDRLRERAEKLLCKKPEILPKNEDKDIKRLVHELQVRQIELEMQNDELRSAQAVIEESRAKYSDLYDFAPVGHFTFNQAGEIVEINLTGASLLGQERAKLLRRISSGFVAPDDLDLFRNHLRNVFARGEKERCELRLIKKDGTSLYASLESISVPQDQSHMIWSAVTDITERKQAEDQIRRLNNQLEQRIIEFRESEGRLRLLSSQLINIQESERKRIAIEIHDSLGQSLNAIKFKFQDAVRQLEKEEEKEERQVAIKQLRDLVPVVQTSIEEARRIQMDLRPSVLDDLGILATISWFCREFQKTYTGIKIDARIEIDEGRLSNTLKTVIYRVLQEAMNNVANHSGASQVFLSLAINGDKTQFAIRDNGQGFDLDEALSKKDNRAGLGLTSMRERTEISGGIFSIESILGKGTTIQMAWPT